MSKQKISGQFAPRLIEMLRSPAYRALSLSGHRVLACLEIELARRGGKDNGDLICTYADLARYGIRRDGIAPAVREVVALGFVEITEQGQAGVGDHRRATRYRITYCETSPKGRSHEWRRIETTEEADAVARAARANRKEMMK